MMLCGLVGGGLGVFFGQKRFKPLARGAQYGRWLAARQFGRLFLLVGLAGTVLVAVGMA